VRATAGDTQLGGDDFDRKLMQRLLAKLPAGATPDASLLQAAKQAAEQAKIALSTRDVVSFAVVDERTGAKLEETLTRAELEALIAPRSTARCSRAGARSPTPTSAPTTCARSCSSAARRGCRTCASASASSSRDSPTRARPRPRRRARRGGAGRRPFRWRS
jgi:hypothetical protein